MLLRITGDFSEESGLTPIVISLAGPTRKEFASHEYGDGLLSIVIVLTSRDPALGFKPRIRFLKAKRELQMDVMIDLNTLVSISEVARCEHVSDSLRREVPRVIRAKRIHSFDSMTFETEWTAWLNAWLRQMRLSIRAGNS